MVCNDVLCVPAMCSTWGGVPLGTHQWDYHDGTKWTKALLTIVEQPAVEVEPEDEEPEPEAPSESPTI